MTPVAAVVDEVIAKVSNHASGAGEEPRMEPIFDPGSNEPEGFVLHAPLERVAIFVKPQDVLSLGDIASIRRAIARAQARRGYLYVLSGTTIQKPVMLLATLSKIRIVRVEPPAVA